MKEMTGDLTGKDRLYFGRDSPGQPLLLGGKLGKREIIPI